MALVTVRRAAGSAGGPAEEDAPRRGQLQRRQSFVMVKGAALLLPAEEPLAAEPPPAAPPGQAPGRQEQHLQLMMQLLRPQDAIRLAVRLESARPRRVRYLLVVRPEEAGAEGQTALLGVDFAHEGAARCTLGMVLPLWSDTQVFLDGDGGFSVTSGGQTRIFKPISVQTMWPAAPELSEQAVRALLRDVMASADLESVTSKEVREELERRTGHSLARHKDFIDNEMLLVLAQMDRPSRVFPHLYLGSEWNAANLEELQQNRVTHILNVAREIDNFFPALFTYMNVRVYDEETAQLLPHWNDTFLFLSRVRAGGGRALVHCRMGLSRSAATVLAYAMKEFGWPLERALRHVRHCRPGVLPNPGFMRQLDFYQGILHASRHSSLWEPKAAERVPQPEEEGGLSPAPSPQPPEEARGPGLLGASRRPRISLCAVMRSISQLESPEPPELPGEPLAGEGFAAAEAPGGPGGVPPGARPSSRPRRVPRQASLDGGSEPACDHAPMDGHAPADGHAPSATSCDPASCPTPASDPTPSADPAPHLPSTPPPAP
ncbi:protein phosphatase Slingshot homolog 3 isoform X2 [Calonectris borealis]|uniref:protein phosphatase Slingshot homolog 3 isoform X2 n=1 Tax=Calonectris borealis TaxID=1323832 RepID=UPI003F4B9213